MVEYKTIEQATGCEVEIQIQIKDGKMASKLMTRQFNINHIPDGYKIRGTQMGRRKPWVIRIFKEDEMRVERVNKIIKSIANEIDKKKEWVEKKAEIISVITDVKRKPKEKGVTETIQPRITLHGKSPIEREEEKGDLTVNASGGRISLWPVNGININKLQKLIRQYRVEEGTAYIRCSESKPSKGPIDINIENEYTKTIERIESDIRSSTISCNEIKGSLLQILQQIDRASKENIERKERGEITDAAMKTTKRALGRSKDEECGRLELVPRVSKRMEIVTNKYKQDGITTDGTMESARNTIEAYFESEKR